MLESLKDRIVGAVQGVVEAVGAASPRVEVAPGPDGAKSLVLVRQGYTLQEKEGPKRNQRRHTFSDLASFAAWMNRHAVPEAAEILVSEAGVSAALTPAVDNGDVVACDLVLHPSFAAWAGLLERPLDQERLHDFVRGHVADFEVARDSKGTSVGSYGEFFAAELRNLEVAVQGKFQKQIDERGFTVLSGGTESASATAKLPPSFVLRLPIYDGVQIPGEVEPKPAQYHLQILLTMKLTKEGEPVFVLRCPELPVVKRAALEDAVDWLTHNLKPEFLVSLGSLKLDRVPVVRS